jgi:hypothetical protein
MKENINITLERLPGFIPFPRVRRPYRGWACAPSEVKTAEDLPSRLFLGDLAGFDPGDAPGHWTARYDDADAQTGAILYSGDSMLGLEQSWRSDTKFCGIAHSHYRNLMQVAESADTWWSKESAADLQSEYKVCWIWSDKDHPHVFEFPDGAFRVFVCPIPVGGLRGVLRFLDDLKTDPAIRCIVAAFAVLVRTWAKYPLAANPGLNARALRLQDAFDVGLLPGDPAHFERDEVLGECVVLPRLHYVLAIAVTFRELFRVAKRLACARILHRRDGPYEGLGRDEWHALVMEPGVEIWKPDIRVKDAGGQWAVHYGRLVTMEAAEAFGKYVDDRDVTLRLIARAEECGDQLLDAVCTRA